MFIYHYRDPSEPPRLITKSIVVVSSDLKHDTYFVRSCLNAVKKHFESKGLDFAQWFIDSDGAASHFKSRFTFKFACSFRMSIGRPLSWETCAGGHGKGNIHISVSLIASNCHVFIEIIILIQAHGMVSVLYSSAG